VLSQGESVARFRRWLIEKLVESCWVITRDEELETTAERLGLRPEILREAQAVLTKRCEQDGRSARKLGSSKAKERRGSRSFMQVVLPKKVHEDWKRYCQVRDLGESTLLRSLIHRTLTFPADGDGANRGGRVYRGERLKLCTDRREDGRGQYLTYVMAEITPGAKEALRRRSRKLGVNPSAIVRESIVELLEGRVRELRIINEVSGMWDDPDRYL
jgi:hypothetical protein